MNTFSLVSFFILLQCLYVLILKESPMTFINFFKIFPLNLFSPIALYILLLFKTNLKEQMDIKFSIYYLNLT